MFNVHNSIKPKNICLVVPIWSMDIMRMPVAPFLFSVLPIYQIYVQQNQLYVVRYENENIVRKTT